MNLKSIWGIVLNSVFPVYCLGCGREGGILCNFCVEDIDFSGVFFCPICHKKNEDGRCCLFCSNDSSLDRHIALCGYQESGLSGKLIQSFKYNYIESVLSIFERGMLQFFQVNKFLEIDLIIPVPLHSRRYVERGFNQAELIARALSGILKVDLVCALCRNRHTKQQARLDKVGRLKNVESAFVLDEKFKGVIRNKKVLIVDDVYTTGATIGECAKVLKNYGATEIVGFSIARG